MEKHQDKARQPRRNRATSAIAALVVAIGTIAALSVTAPRANAGYWSYGFAGTGRTLFSYGGAGGFSSTAYLFNNKCVSPGYFADANPSLSEGDGALGGMIVSPRSLVYSNMMTGQTSFWNAGDIEIDSLNQPYITVSAAWVPTPTMDTNMDGVIDDRDDPAPPSAPSLPLELFGRLELSRGRVTSGSGYAEARITVSYQDSSNAWHTLSGLNIQTPSYPTPQAAYSVSNTVSVSAGEKAYSYAFPYGTATYYLRLDTFGTTVTGSTGSTGSSLINEIELRLP